MTIWEDIRPHLWWVIPVLLVVAGAFTYDQFKDGSYASDCNIYGSVADARACDDEPQPRERPY